MSVRPPRPVPRRLELHLLGCGCPACRPPARLPITRLTFGGIALGNAIAFAIDPGGSWQALTAALRDLAKLW